jgi:hypothetical protein
VANLGQPRKLSGLKARFTFRASLMHDWRQAPSHSVSRKLSGHIIFSTKNREPWLDSYVRPRMHAYLATICRDVGARRLADYLNVFNASYLLSTAIRLSWVLLGEQR